MIKQPTIKITDFEPENQFSTNIGAFLKIGNKEFLLEYETISEIVRSENELDVINLFIKNFKKIAKAGNFKLKIENSMKNYILELKEEINNGKTK